MFKSGAGQVVQPCLVEACAVEREALALSLLPTTEREAASSDYQLQKQVSQFILSLADRDLSVAARLSVLRLLRDVDLRQFAQLAMHDLSRCLTHFYVLADQAGSGMHNGVTRQMAVEMFKLNLLPTWSQLCLTDVSLVRTPRSLMRSLMQLPDDDGTQDTDDPNRHTGHGCRCMRCRLDSVGSSWFACLAGAVIQQVGSVESAATILGCWKQLGQLASHSDFGIAVFFLKAVTEAMPKILLRLHAAEFGKLVGSMAFGGGLLPGCSRRTFAVDDHAASILAEVRVLFQQYVTREPCIFEDAQLLESLFSVFAANMRVHDGMPCSRLEFLILALKAISYSQLHGPEAAISACDVLSRGGIFAVLMSTFLISLNPSSVPTALNMLSASELRNEQLTLGFVELSTVLVRHFKGSLEPAVAAALLEVLRYAHQPTPRPVTRTAKQTRDTMLRVFGSVWHLFFSHHYGVEPITQEILNEILRTSIHVHLHGSPKLVSILQEHVAFSRCLTIKGKLDVLLNSTDEQLALLKNEQGHLPWTTKSSSVDELCALIASSRTAANERNELRQRFTAAVRLAGNARADELLRELEQRGSVMHRDTEQQFLTNLLTSCPLTYLTPDCFVTVAHLFNRWSQEPEKQGLLVLYCDALASAAEIVSVHFPCNESRESVIDSIMRAVVQDGIEDDSYPAPSDWSNCVKEMAASLNCDASLTAFNRLNMRGFNPRSRAKVARKSLSLSTSLQVLVNHAVAPKDSPFVKVKNVSAAEVEQLADALSGLAGTDPNGLPDDVIDVWRSLISLVLHSMDMPFLHSPERVDNQVEEEDEQWKTGLEILRLMSGVVCTGAGSWEARCSAFASVIRSMNLRDHYSSGERALLQQLCSLLKQSSSLGVLELLAEFVGEAALETADNSCTRPRLCHVEQITTLIVHFARDGGVALMVDDIWAWLRAEQVKDLPPDQPHICLPGPPRIRHTFALLLAVKLCTEGCAAATVNTSLVNVVTTSLYSILQKDYINHFPSTEICQTAVRSMMKVGTHENVVDLTEKLFRCERTEMKSFRSSHAATSQLVADDRLNAVALVAMLTACERMQGPGKAIVGSPGMATLFLVDPQAKVDLLFKWVDAIVQWNQNMLWSDGVQSVAFSMLHSLQHKSADEVRSVIPVLNACLARADPSESRPLDTYSVVQQLLTKHDPNVLCDTQLEFVSAIFECRSLLARHGDIDSDWGNFLWMLIDLPALSIELLQEVAPSVARATKLLNGQWGMNYHIRDSRYRADIGTTGTTAVISPPDDKAKEQWLKRALALVAQLTDEDVEMICSKVARHQQHFHYNRGIGDYVILPLLCCALRSTGFDALTFGLQVNEIISGVEPLRELVGKHLHDFEQHCFELLVTISDEHKVLASPLAVKGWSYLIESLRRVEPRLARAAFRRARAVLMVFPELYASASFDRLLAFWLRVDALLVIGSNEHDSLTFGVQSRSSLAQSSLAKDGLDFSSWQRVLLTITSVTSAENERLAAIDWYTSVCEEMWAAQQDVFVHKYAGLVLSELGDLFVEVNHEERAEFYSRCLRLTQANLNICRVAPRAPALLAMVLIWSKNSSPRLGKDALTANGIERIIVATAFASTEADAGLLLNLLQVHGLDGCDAMPFAHSDAFTTDTLRSIALCRRLEGVVVYEQVLLLQQSCIPPDADLIEAAARAAASVGLVTNEEVVSVLLAVAGWSTVPFSCAIMALHAHLELSSSPDLESITQVIRTLESRVENSTAAAQFGDLLERMPLRVWGGAASTLANPECFELSLFGHDDAPLALFSHSFTGATLATTSHTRPHIGYSLHQFAHVPNSLRSGDYWLRWRFLLAHAACASEIERAAAQARAKELVATVVSEGVKGEESAIDEAFAGASPSRLAEYLVHIFSRDTKPWRYLPFPLTLPPGAYLFRGISPRFGDKLCDTAVVNLLARGCGPADLTRAPPDADHWAGALWLKVGQTFCSASFNKSHAFASQMPRAGALISLSSAYFHAAQRSGRCRVEKTSSNDMEGAFNPVFYDPIPHFAIERVWLPKSLEAPLRAVASGQDSPEITAILGAPLAALRRALNSIPSKTVLHAQPHSLLDRLVFLDLDADVAVAVAKECPAANNAELLLWTLTELLLCLDCHQRLVRSDQT